MSDCKESLVQRQNRVFNERDAASVDEVVGKSELLGVNAWYFHRAEVVTYLEVDHEILRWDHCDVGPHSIEQD